MPGKGKRMRQFGSNDASANNTANSDSVTCSIDNVLAKASSSSLPNMEELLRAVLETLKKFGDSIDRFNERIETMDEKLRDTEKERDSLKVENGRLKNELERKSVQLEMELENRERYSRRFNVKISGMETDGKTKTEVLDAALKLHNDHSSAAISSKDVYEINVFKPRQFNTNSAAGKPTGSTVILSMQSVDIKKRFMSVGKPIHDDNASVFIGDDLTVGQRKLLYELKQRKDIFEKVVFRDGVVRCLKRGGGWQQFAFLHEMQKLPKQTNQTEPTDE